MKKTFAVLLISAVSFSSFSQVAPQENFIEKISLSDQNSASGFLKTPPVFCGNNYDLKYHRFCWNIDPDTLFISGEVTSYFVTTEPNTDKITFDFSSVMIVDSVLYHSSKISYLHNQGDTLEIILPSALPDNQPDSVSVFYHGNPPQGNGFGSFRKDFHNGVPIIWTLSEPYGAEDWWPCKNNLSDKIDSTDIIVTTPQQYNCSSNGLLVSETVQNLKKTSHWKHRYPIAAYLVAVAVTDYQSFSFYVHNGNDSTEILNYVYPENLADAMLQAPTLTPSFELFDSLFITYPFINEHYGMTMFGVNGGMEHQTMTFLGNFGFELMTHELAHQWVGDMITCSNWHDIWLNEGFATYWTGLSYEHLFNGYYWPLWKKNAVSKITSSPDGSVYCTDTTSVSRVFDGRLSYYKGAMLLHMLRWTIGDSAFYAGFRSYLTDTALAFNYACSDDFIKHIENASGRDLTYFFNDWLYGEGYPVYTIVCQKSSVSNDMLITISQAQSHSSVDFFEMPVPLRFKNAIHDTVLVFDNTFSGQQYSVNIGFSPDSVFFDPDMQIVSAGDTVILSIDENFNLPEISVFPNPVNDVLSVEYPAHQLKTAALYDIRGILVDMAIPDNSLPGEIKINMRNISGGIYFLKAIFGNDILIRKIVKI